MPGVQNEWYTQERKKKKYGQSKFIKKIALDF